MLYALHFIQYDVGHVAQSLGEASREKGRAASVAVALELGANPSTRATLDSHPQLDFVLVSAAALRDLFLDDEPHAAQGLRERACHFWRGAEWPMLPTFRFPPAKGLNSISTE